MSRSRAPPSQLHSLHAAAASSSAHDDDDVPAPARAAPVPAAAVADEHLEEAEDPNDEMCRVCWDGGELVVCDKCPQVRHISS